MRVLYFINAGIMGGRERHVYTLVKSLPKDIEYLICAVSSGESTKEMQVKGCNVRVLGCRNGHDVRLLWRFYKVIKGFKPDLIHAHSEAIIPFWVLRFFKSIPIVYSIHGPSTDAAECGVRGRPFWGCLKSKIEKLLKRKPDYFLPVSKATWEEFLTLTPKVKGEVFFNALDFSILPNSEKKVNVAPVVGMVARLADQKGWSSFLEIAAELVKRIPNVKIWAIGDGPLKANLQEYWRRLSIEEKIPVASLIWFGSRQDARELISKMDVFLFTSKREQLPTTLLEAFALGTPVVGFLPIGGTKEILGLSSKKIALLNESRNVGQAVRDVLLVLEDKILRQELVDEGQRIVRNYFDMRTLCSTQLRSVYKRLIKGDY